MNSPSRVHLVLLPGMDGTGLLLAPLLAALRDLGASVSTTIDLAAPGETRAVADSALARTPCGPCLQGSELYSANPRKTELQVLQGVTVSVLPHQCDQPPSDEHLQVSLLHRLKAGDRPIILAESFSGPWAMRLLRDWPAVLGTSPVGLIMACSFVRNPQRWAGPFRAVARVLPPVQPAGPALRVIERALYGRAPSLELCAALRASLAEVRPAVMKARLHAVLASEESATWQTLRLLTLVLSARQDELVPPLETQHMLALRPGCQHVTLHGPHGLLQAKPAATARAIADFVSGCTVDAKHHR